jgi:glycosidase
MQWDDSPNAGFTTGQPFAELVAGELDYQHINVKDQLADRNSLFHTISQMIQTRKEYHAFGRGTMEWAITDNPSLVAYSRKYRDENLLILHNLSDSAQSLTVPSEHQTTYVDLLANREREVASMTTLQPYEFLWLKR